MDIVLPPSGEFMASCDKAIRAWQESYEKTVVRLTAKVTWRELMIGEFYGWLLVFKVPQISSMLMPLCDDFYSVIKERFRSIREHYRFSRMTPAEQKKHLDDMKPSTFKLIAAGAMLVMPLFVGLRARKR